MREIGGIQVLRGVAALGVVAFHAQQELMWRHLPSLLPDLLIGAAGVDVFFVVSGFIILYASAPLFGRAASVILFARRRVARIVPLYWLTLAVYALYAAAYHLPPYDLHAIERGLVLSMLFVPAHDNAPLLTTGWTLNFEMFFYTLFALALPFERRRAVTALSAGLVAYGVAGVLGWLPGWGSALASSLLFEFVAGLWIAEVCLSGVRLSRVGSVALVGGGVFAFAVIAAFDFASYQLWRGVVWGLPATALVAGCALATGRQAGRVRRIFERLGDVSYALYIVHYVLFGFLSRVALPWFPTGRLGVMAYFALLMVAALGAGWLIHIALERPMYRWMTGRRLRPTGPKLPERGALTDLALHRVGLERI